MTTTARILIVDDDALNRTSLKARLGQERPSWCLLEAASFADGIRDIDAGLKVGEPIGIALVDQGLDNGHTGLELIRELRSRDPSLISILYTSQPNLDRHTAFDQGAFDVVEKNSKGTLAAGEILLKAERALTIKESEERLNFLSRFFDRAVWGTVSKEQSLLNSLLDGMQELPVTICFWDIRGFSRVSEALRSKPTLVTEFLKAFADAAAGIIFAHDGILDKFIGDGVMAIFGLVGSNSGSPDSGALNAVNAAIALRMQFAALAGQHKDRWTSAAGGRKVEVALRCGIHSGEVLVGCVGSSMRDQFTAFGDNVNIAARFEQAASRGNECYILVSESVRLLLKGRIHTTYFDKLEVKNIYGEFPAYYVDL